MADECIDIYDEHNVKIGDEMKSIAHQQALRHRTVHVWIVDGKGHMLLQRRSYTKKTYPGARDIATAGHIAMGEDPLTGAQRELYEEMGLIGQLEEIATVKRVVDMDNIEYYDREHLYVYVCKLSQDAHPEFRDEEVIAAQRFSLDQAKRILSCNDSSYPACDREDEYMLVETYLHENNLA